METTSNTTTTTVENGTLCLRPPAPVEAFLKFMNGTGLLPTSIQKKMTPMLIPNTPVEFYTVPRNTCPYSARAMITLIELDIPFQMIEVPFELPDDTGKSHPPQWYLHLNPKGKTPTLRFPAHDNQVIYESSICTQFLCDYSKSMQNKSSHLIPIDPFQKAKMSLLNDHADSNLIPAIFTYLMSKHDPDDASACAKMEKQFEYHERALSESEPEGPYLLGKDFTLADVHLAPFMYRMDVALRHFKNYELPFNKFPKLLGWYELCRGRESVSRAECSEDAIIENFSHFIKIDYDFGGLNKNQNGNQNGNGKVENGKVDKKNKKTKSKWTKKEKSKSRQ